MDVVLRPHWRGVTERTILHCGLNVGAPFAESTLNGQLCKEETLISDSLKRQRTEKGTKVFKTTTC